MQGFFQDYYSGEKYTWEGKDILWTYTPEQLTTINSLARNFGVSDRWFSSLPSDTNPNRAFSICGTSLGRESNQKWDSHETFDTPTLFNRLAEAGRSWGMYYHDKWVGDDCYTAYTFPHLKNAGGQIADISVFYKLAMDGKLPDFTFIEPSWTGLLSEANDYHPKVLGDNGFIGKGEDFLNQVFTSLQSSSDWQDMLFIVTFDEHGGTYDHVPPPCTAMNPDGRNGIENGFQFCQFGARVPTLLISPYIPKGTVFRSKDYNAPFDHTSFIRTVLNWAGMKTEDMNLGKRAQNAPTFEDALSDHRVNDTASAGPLHDNPGVEGPPFHPAGTNKELKAMLINIPGAATKGILARSKTKEEAQAAVALYWQDPEKFEALLG